MGGRGYRDIISVSYTHLDVYKRQIFYKLFTRTLLGVCLLACEDETKHLPLPQAVHFTMTVNNTTFVMGEKLVVDLDINPDKDGSEVLALSLIHI